jgi:outer membrane autotransporter protein
MISNSISSVALAATFGGVTTSALASPAVFFNDDTAAGLQTFTNVINAADAAYNAANPGATQQSNIFAIDLNNSTGGTFSVSANGQTVYVVTTLAGNPAQNNANGDENSLGFTEWSVGYTRGDFNSAIAQGYTIAFYSDVSLTTPYTVNAAGLFVSDWGTCCTTNNTKPDGSSANASEIYMMFNGSTPMYVGGISTSIGGEEHFVAAIDDSNSFSSVTLVPNGVGERFGAGGYLIFSNVQIGSVPAGSSEVTVGSPSTPDIDDDYTFTQLQGSQVNPVFDGGTLTATADATVSNGITIKGTGGTIDTDGHNTVLTGAVSDATGSSGNLAKTGDGTLTLAATNGYTGKTTVSGGTLALTGTGSIANSSELVADGTFDISATSGGTALKNLSGHGAVNLGSQSLMITNGNGSFDGSITGTGSFILAGGNFALNGNNSQRITGITGGRLVAASAQSLGASNGDLYIGANSTFAAGSTMSISQNVHIGGANAVFDTGANNVTLTGGLDGNQCLIKEGEGRLTLAAVASNAIGACVQQGTLSFNNVFTGNVWVEQSGTASGSGAINGNVEVRGRLAPGNSPGQLIVAGSVTQMAGSTLSVDIDGTTPGNGAGHFDTLVLVGANSVYTAAGTIEPVLRGITGSATNSFNPQIGQRFQVVTADGGVVGTYDHITQPAIGLPTNSRFDVLYNPNSIVLFVTPNDYRTMFSAGTMLNAAATGGAVDAFRTDAGTVNSGATGVLLDGLYPLSSARVGRALEQASGAIYANVMDSVVQATRFAHNAVSDHLNAGVDGIDADAPLASRVWGVMSRDITHVDSDAHGQGYRGNNFTMVLGADRAVGSNALLGAAFAYNRNKTGTDYIGNASADSYHGMVYGRINANSWYVNGLLSFGVDKYNVSRSVDLSTGTQAARGEGEGVSFGADAETGYKLSFGKAQLTPAVGISYDGLRRNGFAETGDDSVALTLDKDFRRSVAARAGARLSTAFSAGSAVIVPYASAFVNRELNDQSSLITPTLHGTRFRVIAPEQDRTSARFNAGVNAALSSGVALQLSYRHSNAGNFSANAVTGGVSIRW